MRKLFASTSVRLALGYAALFAASSLVLVGFLWWQTVGYLDREIDAAVIADIRAIGDRLRDFGLPGAMEAIDERVGKVIDKNAIYLLADPVLTRLAGNLEAWPLEVGRDPGWYRVELVHRGDLHATRLLHVVLPGQFHLLVGRDVQDRIAVRSLIVQGLGWSAGAAFVLAVAGGLLVRRAVLRRVDSINRTATAIVRGDLSQRVPTRGSADEFDQLAQTINGLLHQIQLLIEGIRNSSNVVAHDLRTPLTELRARLEDLLRCRPPPDQAFAQVEDAVADIDRVIAIFNALLRLADIDSGVRRAGFRQVALADLAAEVFDLYGPVAEDKAATLTVEVPEPMAVDGDPHLLAQAMGNLVDNAVKFAGPGGKITLALARRADGGTEITVSDNGPGIPDSEKAQVTDRFYRGSAGNGAAGVGLGLSTVAAIARLHDGTLTLSDHHPGLIATLTLPASGS